MKFLIQTIDNQIVHDFAFTLIEAIRFHKWKGTNYEYILSDTISELDCIPIGSVEFVSEYIKKYYNIDIIPINVPYELMLNRELTGRYIYNGDQDYTFDKRKFVKSNDKIKSFTDIIEPNTKLPEGKYQFSELIQIESEYRCFVYQNKLVGIKNYSGDFTIFPNIHSINKMIESFKKLAPIAYTLDVGILDNDNTVVIEVHDFFSCGLYGFNDLRILPLMFIRWFNDNVVNRRRMTIY